VASLIYKPPAGGNLEAVEVRLSVGSGMIYTFSPGVPTDVLPEHVSNVTAALQALAGTLPTEAAPTVSLVGPGGDGTTTYTYEVVAVDADGDGIPSATASPPAALSTPPAPTGTHTAASTNLTVGTYTAKATYTNAQGETVGSATSSGVSAAAGDKVTWTASSVPAGATGVNFYLIAGGSGVTLGFIGSAVPSGGVATLDLLTATQGNTVTAPVANTTGSPSALSTSSYCHITWTAPSTLTGAVTNYKVIRTVGGPSQGLVATVASNVTSYDDKGGAATTYTPVGANPGLVAVGTGPGEI